MSDSIPRFVFGESVIENLVAERAKVISDAFLGAMKLMSETDSRMLRSWGAKVPPKPRFSRFYNKLNVTAQYLALQDVFDDLCSRYEDQQVPLVDLLRLEHMVAQGMKDVYGYITEVDRYDPLGCDIVRLCGAAGYGENKLPIRDNLGVLRCATYSPGQIEALNRIYEAVAVIQGQTTEFPHENSASNLRFCLGILDRYKKEPEEAKAEFDRYMGTQYIDTCEELREMYKGVVADLGISEDQIGEQFETILNQLVTRFYPDLSAFNKLVALNAINATGGVKIDESPESIRDPRLQVLQGVSLGGEGEELLSRLVGELVTDDSPVAGQLSNDLMQVGGLLAYLRAEGISAELDLELLAGELNKPLPEDFKQAVLGRLLSDTGYQGMGGKRPDDQSRSWWIQKAREYRIDLSTAFPWERLKREYGQNDAILLVLQVLSGESIHFPPESVGLQDVYAVMKALTNRGVDLAETVSTPIKPTDNVGKYIRRGSWPVGQGDNNSALEDIDARRMLCLGLSVEEFIRLNIIDQYAIRTLGLEGKLLEFVGQIVQSSKPGEGLDELLPAIRQSYGEIPGERKGEASFLAYAFCLANDRYDLLPHLMDITELRLRDGDQALFASYRAAIHEKVEGSVRIKKANDVYRSVPPYSPSDSYVDAQKLMKVYLRSAVEAAEIFDYYMDALKEES